MILLAVVVLLWLLSRTRRRDLPPAADSHSDKAPPKPMLACAECGIHLPRDEALPGRGGVFCSEAHRETYERAHPDR